MQTFHIQHLTADVFLPADGKVSSVTYILDAFRQDFTTFPPLPPKGSALVFLSGMDWDDDLSPWPAPALYKNAPAFGGHADAFLSFFLKDLIPAIEAKTNITASSRHLVGVSLAGLFAVYAACKTDTFSAIASISGSLWYDGLSDFLASHPVSPAVQCAYFSVGSKEKKVRNPRMAVVEDRTKDVAALWQSAGIETTFELNPGNHFVDGPERIMKALSWLARQ